MSISTQSIVLSPLGGISQRRKPKANTAETCHDLRFSPSQEWRSTGGFRSIVDDPSAGSHSFVGEGIVTWMAHHQQHGGVRNWQLYETSEGALRYFDGSRANTSGRASCWSDVYTPDGDAIDGVTKSRPYTTTPTEGPSHTAWGSNLYIASPRVAVGVFNGRYLEDAGFRGPAPAPMPSVSSSIAEVTTTIQGLGLGTYSEDALYGYAMTEVNERGQESPPSSINYVSFANASNTHFFVRVAAPLGGPTCVARRFYRTVNCGDSTNISVPEAGTTLFFLRELGDNVTTVFEDLAPDSLLGSVMNPADFGPYPREVRDLVEHKGSIFAIVDDMVRHSAPLQPEVWPAGNLFPMGGEGGKPVALVAMSNTLLVLRTRGVDMIKGGGNQPFQMQTLSVGHGCVAGRTARVVPGLGAVFLSVDGLRLVQGTLENSQAAQTTVLLTTDMMKTMRRVTRGAEANARAELLPRHGEYVIALPVDGVQDNQLLCRFDYDGGGWSTSEDTPAACLAESQDARGYMFIGSHDTTDRPGILVATDGEELKGHADYPVAPLYETSAFDYGARWQSLTVAHVALDLVAHGLGVEVNLRANQQEALVKTPDWWLRPMQDPTDSGLLDTYGDAVWDAGTWGRTKNVTVLVNASAAHLPPVRELQVSIRPVGFRMTLGGIDVELSKGATAVKPLHAGFGLNTWRT